MSLGSKVRDEEKENIIRVAYALRHKNPEISLKSIGKVVKRSDQTVHRVMSDKRFSRFRDDFKKKIDEIRFRAIAKGDLQVEKAIDDGQLKPYQIIGMSKTYYEQSFNLQNPTVAIQNNQQVQVTEGPSTSYNTNPKSNVPK